ncbi:uracil phosphoribosyltransferase [Gramella sp. AN32]|uniref:Uracil phosphoribosyltransferase n=1 Tax=Christiangramia antarctica TaxID=2058158 RepID=A0ABW5X3U5_9FLAO|nr:uracil phosphoribosyltransferase [Gramella sp. AN32]MCM4155023.1 uracil phosphoribosyltransferase [Gramella sp. AN32]
MKDFFEGIAWLFENILFYPYDALRSLELDSWFFANIVNWLLMIIGILAFLYWMRELKGYNDRDEENRDPSAHSFLG